MYIVAGQVQTTPLDTSVTCYKFQKKFFFFMILYMYIAPRQGLTTHDVNGNILVFRLFVSSFKTIFLKSDFIHLFAVVVFFFFFFFFFFHDFIHDVALGQGQIATRGQIFYVNRNILSLHSFVTSFKEISFKV